MSGTQYRGPINPNPKDDEAGIIIYGYVPSLVLAVIGMVTFALVAAVHLFWGVSKRGQLRPGVKGRKWFHLLLFVGALMEVGGYAARIASHRRPFVVSTFVAQYFLIVVAPVLFSAAIYLSLSLAARGFVNGECLLVIRPKIVLVFFVTVDIVCTIIQVAGAALIGTSESARVRGNYSRVTPEQANDILLAGLAVQCFSFTCFLLIMVVAIYRASRPSFGSNNVNSHLGEHDNLTHRRLRRFLWVILVTGLLILLRTTFRLAETAQGVFGFASTHESLFGTLEYLPVILALTIWAVAPPAEFVPPTREDGLGPGIPSSGGSHAGLREKRDGELSESMPGARV